MMVDVVVPWCCGVVVGRGAARSDDARVQAAAAVLGAKEDDPVRGDGRAEAILGL